MPSDSRASIPTMPSGSGTRPTGRTGTSPSARTRGSPPARTSRAPIPRVRAFQLPGTGSFSARWDSSADGSVFPERQPIQRDLAVADHDQHILERRDVLERVPTHDDQIRLHTFLNRAGP